MYHTKDLRARAITYESFYLGPDLYIAPVLDPQVFELDVHLPGSAGKRTYTHIWTGMRYEAGQDITVPTPYGKPAIFIVNGSTRQELQPLIDFVRRENGTNISVH